MRKLTLSIITIIISLVLIAFFKPMLLNYLTGTARVLEKDSAYYLKINNKQFESLIYKSTQSFDKKSNHNLLILNLKNLKVKSKFRIILVDLNNKIIGYTCASSNCYDMILGYLFQSEVGSFYVALENSVKGPGFNTNLKIENEKIDFFIPGQSVEKIHIQILKSI